MLDALLIGSLAGILHVVAGPDHLAAIAPLASRRSGAWIRGFVWGVGHTSGVWAVGCVALLMQGLLPLQLVSSLGERLAAGALILVGLRTLVHWARRDEAASALRPPTTRVDVQLASGFGILHGLGGSSHYLGILPALGFSDPISACLYLAAFGCSTIGAMTACAFVMGLLSRPAGTRAWLAPIAGCVAIVVGVLWLAGPPARGG
ncbi:MAG: High-affinity nickel transporter [Gemmatimonadetes bacterium]|jgi:hypothetical protein|nr:High-affinity nickel transporter [Gemmatimonadota bacterium]MBT6149782.1 High-affinity nickel transporter [Gemmatimonadota bacterium]